MICQLKLVFVAYRSGPGPESVSNGIAQNKKCTVILINSE
jgi:hypothetical protein